MGLWVFKIIDTADGFEWKFNKRFATRAEAWEAGVNMAEIMFENEPSMIFAVCIYQLADGE